MYSLITKMFVKEMYINLKNNELDVGYSVITKMFFKEMYINLEK